MPKVSGWCPVAGASRLPVLAIRGKYERSKRFYTAEREQTDLHVVP